MLAAKKLATAASAIDPRTLFADHHAPLALELGGSLSSVRAAYRTWGTLSPSGDNAVIVCHAFSASADVDTWWPGLLGQGRALDPEKDFIVCSNVLGSCYGTTGPTSEYPRTGLPYGPTFPNITVRDMVRLQIGLARELGIKRIRAVVGGSLGGMQALEWALLAPDLVESLVVIAASGRHSAWCIGLSEAQREAIYADPDFRSGRYAPDRQPLTGLRLARMIAMCTYRTRRSFEQRFGRKKQDEGRFAVDAYLRHQGDKLVGRFDANTYITLTRAMDTHDLARDRGEYKAVLASIAARTLVVSINSDVLYPVEEQVELASAIPKARLAHLRSPHGHDSFLIETQQLNELVLGFRATGENAGVAGRFRDAPGSLGINVKAIAQGASPPSLPRAIDATHPRAAVRTVHSVFDSAHQDVSLFVLGKGTVASALLEQLRSEQARLVKDHELRVRVFGFADRQRLLFREQGVALEHWRDELACAPGYGDSQIALTLAELGRMPIPIVVDCTAADGMQELYAAAFEQGAHVVTANKRPLSVAHRVYERLLAQARSHDRSLRYQTTVGAGLPVIETLKDLVRTGDAVRRIEGSLSGTLGYLAGELMAGVRLSRAVGMAKRLGYTEPNPQEDLSGRDLVRKAIIMARELGAPMEVADVTVDHLVPRELLAPMPAAKFHEALGAFDPLMAERIAVLKKHGRVLRYLVSIAPMKRGGWAARIGPVEIPESHAAAHLHGPEAFVAFQTERYSELPLIVRGPGAGGQVTAAGVLADILKISQSVRGRSGGTRRWQHNHSS